MVVPSSSLISAMRRPPASRVTMSSIIVTSSPTRLAGPLGIAGGVEAVDLGDAAVDVGLDPAHDVVLARPDDDRLGGDVDAGEVLADVDDLAQRLEHALLRHHGDVEVDPGPVGAHAAALVD